MNLSELSDEELICLFKQKQGEESAFNSKQQAFKIALNSLR